MKMTTNCSIMMHIMFASLFFLIATTAVIAGNGANNSSLSAPSVPKPPLNAPTKYSFQFVVSWVNGFCLIYTCKLNPQKPPPPPFSVHGLWPVEVPGCTDSNIAFNYGEFGKLPKLSQLRQCWPNLLGQLSEDKFWQKEWDRHGKKCNKFDSVFTYFTASVDLYAQLQTNLNLFAQEHVRSARKTAALVREWDRWVNSKPFVVCRKDKSNKNYLMEFRFCLNDQRQFINCDDDNKQRSLCSEKFEYTKQSMSFVGQLKDLMEAMPI